MTWFEIASVHEARMLSIADMSLMRSIPIFFMMATKEQAEATAHEFRVYTATLSLGVKNCEDALKMLADIDDGKVVFPNDLKKGRCKEMVLGYLIVELRKLLDRQPGTISFEHLEEDWKGRADAGLLKAYKAGLSKVRQKHIQLIRRIAKNRNVKGAHVQRKEELGFDPEMARMLNEWNEATGDPCRYQPVEKERQHLLLSTLPRAELKGLLTDLKSLIHFGLWCLPKTDEVAD